MDIAEHKDADSYVHFNAFFTRPLKAGARPIDRAADIIISPVDGVISAAGKLDGMRIYQAKGRDYSLHALLAANRALAQQYIDGDFLTLYLSPRDYHRVHMPLAGRLDSMVYVPGCLFSVNALTAAHINALFARNERLICTFNTVIGQVSIIMVAAIFVGGMEVAWHGQVTPATSNNGERIQRYDYADKPLTLRKGEEMGRFNMGSTVIMLTEKDRIHWSDKLRSGKRLAMGGRIGELR